MEGMNLKFNSQVSTILPFKIMGKKKGFDFEVIANLGTKDVRGLARLGGPLWISPIYSELAYS